DCRRERLSWSFMIGPGSVYDAACGGVDESASRIDVGVGAAVSPQPLRSAWAGAAIDQPRLHGHARRPMPMLLHCTIEHWGRRRLKSIVISNPVHSVF